ncbi:hypothetical protein PAXRUDRAFT_800731 [Paxillus rubicundulus Ve08.2h10]|uniref:Uncharacterized protein n=1 Tax=Paxillus rubicundulus Ve08.2h10 TaxID=930991 RepID=A0A0D0DRX0_9AGAM|nr:hypothetical protein PAXRUDRAFT_800731 [Paxillus rubicundulus Ve08.2h10]
MCTKKLFFARKKSEMDKSQSFTTLQDCLRAATGHMVRMSSTFEIPKVSSMVELLLFATSLQPSSEKYQSSMNSKFFSFRRAYWEGCGMMTFPTSTSLLKSFIFGFSFLGLLALSLLCRRRGIGLLFPVPDEPLQLLQQAGLRLTVSRSIVRLTGCVPQSTFEPGCRGSALHCRH